MFDPQAGMTHGTRVIGLGHKIHVGMTYWQSMTARYEELVAAGDMTERLQVIYDSRMATEGIVYTLDDKNKFRIVSGEEKLWKGCAIARDYGLEDWESNIYGELSTYDFSILRALHYQALYRLEDMQLEFDEFKEQIRVSLPDLAGKNFGFTINEHGSLEITSPDGALTDREKKQLEAWINDRDRLKELTFDHAKLVTYILKHDPRLGVEDSMVTLGNISKFIDYGVLLQSCAIRPGNENSWMEQLQRNVREMTREQEADRASENNPGKV
ncbi:hypothetical protein AABC73_07715 [Pseudomonas sp. G.S.17]|uniref:hypothetical protein n=1 Tax=Pseudomonas sp. G.S.17 TaxID=3137451 RepID=UPI00311C95F7